MNLEWITAKNEIAYDVLKMEDISSLTSYISQVRTPPKLITEQELGKMCYVLKKSFIENSFKTMKLVPWILYIP